MTARYRPDRSDLLPCAALRALQWRPRGLRALAASMGVTQLDAARALLQLREEGHAARVTTCLVGGVQQHAYRRAFAASERTETKE